MNNTLVKGLLLLEQLARSRTSIGVTELAARLDISKSNAHRMLQALIELNYVHQAPNSEYRASLRLWEMGSAVLANFDVRAIAQPFMQELALLTRETVHLSVLDGMQVVYVDKIDSPEPVRAYSEIGGRAPAHCVATGKALLAEEDDARLAVYAAQLEKFTERTLTDPAEFLQEMNRVRQQGYAINRGEWRPSVHGLAAVIRDVGGGAVAAIGISGPAERLKPALLKSLAGKVQACAASATRALTTSHRPDTTSRLLAGMRRPQVAGKRTAPSAAPVAAAAPEKR